MPKYYCDYCDTYLTHDSPSVRKTHCTGRKHKDNVKFYYQKWMEEQAQNLIDATTAAFKAGKIAQNPFAQPPPKGVAIPPPNTLAPPPRPGMMPAGIPHGAPGMPQMMMGPHMMGIRPPSMMGLGPGMMAPPPMGQYRSMVNGPPPQLKPS
ncbi:U1 small nuclear ribonucleoprotein C [Phlebotomus argentipes]|uniref:U1 small nuclear ribonucleoprotein C n=1 Tax=Phlebotomus argentipes TaxID=94469 RepID=UPI0028935FE8|nr:U1 small nuclear ribonucleoprotein C [Phlebotomus argentipes]